MTLNAQNQPQSAVMTGGVKYGVDDPLRQARGEAAEGRAAFDKTGHPERVVMTGAVHLHERVRATDAATEPWSERELNAGAVELALASDPVGKAQLRDAKATGDARLKVTSVAAKGGTTSSALGGDVLTAHFVRVGDADHIAEVHGGGHTTLRKVSATGVVDTSSADSLVAHFRPVMAGAGRGQSVGGKGLQRKRDELGGTGGDEVSDATELGHVVMTQLPVRKPGDATAPVEQRVTAERAVYDHGAGDHDAGDHGTGGHSTGESDLERTTLTGNVQVSDGTSVLWADRVVSEQQSGNATADGSVKASYGQIGSAEEPVHVLAARAELNHDAQIAIFHGVAGKPARLWQGASQVDAPVLQFEQKQKRLRAYGEGQGAPMAVHTVLVSAGSAASSVKADAAKPGAAAGKIAGAGRKTDVIRVASRELTYSDEARKAEFTGGIQVESGDGSMKGQQVVVYLEPAQTGGAGKVSSNSGKRDVVKTTAASATGGSGFMGGSVEKMVASGRIEMQQPGRRATGEQVVYTASDGMYVLTGTAAVLPKVIDNQRGTVTGTSLRFYSGDGNVVVSNEGDSNTGQRVRTETRVKNRQ
jgi:lipopolysaccharide export system protein LptA